MPECAESISRIAEGDSKKNNIKRNKYRKTKDNKEEEKKQNNKKKRKRKGRQFTLYWLAFTFSN